jgi:hypothetical protein
MAGTIITRPVNGATDWTNFDTIQSRSMKGFLDMSLEGMTTGSVPTILAGSHIEINASIYQFSADYAPNASSWTAISSASNVFLKAIPSGTTCTVEYTTTAPTWSSSKKGWYTSNDRIFAWMRKDSTGALYKYKHFMPGTEVPNVLFIDTLDIGDWNMDSTATINVAHEIEDYHDIKSMSVHIRNDADDTIVVIGTSEGNDAYFTIGTTNVALVRAEGGNYDAATYDATSYNRGWITFTHEEI